MKLLKNLQIKNITILGSNGLYSVLFIDGIDRIGLSPYPIAKRDDIYRICLTIVLLLNGNNSIRKGLQNTLKYDYFN